MIFYLFISYLKKKTVAQNTVKFWNPQLGLEILASNFDIFTK